MKLLFVSGSLDPSNKNGAYRVSKRNIENLSRIFFNKNMDVILSHDFKDRTSKGVWNKYFNILFRKRLGKMTPKLEKMILEKIKINKYKIIFIDSSVFGYLVEKIKKRFPNVIVITFFHDVNKHLFSNMGNKKKIKTCLLKKIAIVNEKKVIENTDKIITLNKRDSNLIKKFYKRETNEIIPVTFLNEKKEFFYSKEKGKLLFVGVDYLPNVEGIRFFIKNILEKLNYDLEIVGKGMEKYKKEFENLSKKVKVVGTVDDLSKYYTNSIAVVLPIFSGGGMKVKTAEALKYGKYLFGTKEAFEGYELNFEKVGGLCNTADEFIKKINSTELSKKNNYSFKIFEEKYSYEASIKKFKKLLG